MQHDNKTVTNHINKVAVEYRERLQQILDIERSDDDVLVKKLKCQFLRENIIQDFSDILGNDLPRTINYHLQLIRDESVSIDSEDDEFLLKDFLKTDTKLDWLVPSFFTLGSFYLFAAKAKSGKTDFINYMMRCVTIPDMKFLGTPCLKGPVLIFQLEESKTNIKLKAKQHGLLDYYKKDVDNKAHPIIVVRSIDLVNDFTKLEKKIEKYKPVLVVLDTVRGVMQKSGLSEVNDSFANIFYQVQFLAIQKNITIIGLHHTRKDTSGNDEDMLDAVAGTGKMVSIGDGTVVMKRSKDTDETFLYFFSRDINRRTIVLGREQDELKRINYKLLREVGVSSSYEQLKNKILVLLKIHERLKESEIALQLSQDVSFTLNRLCELFLVDYEIENEELVYFIPKDSMLLWDGVLKEEEKQTVDLAVKMTSLETEEDITSIKEQHSIDTTRKAFDLLPEKEQLELWKKRYPPKYKNKIEYEGKIYLLEVVKVKPKGKDTRPDYLYRLCTTLGVEYPKLLQESDLDEQLQHFDQGQIDTREE